jgi:hypothetical protein
VEQGVGNRKWTEESFPDAQICKQTQSDNLPNAAIECEGKVRTVQ